MRVRGTIFFVVLSTVTAFLLWRKIPTRPSLQLPIASQATSAPAKEIFQSPRTPLETKKGADIPCLADWNKLRELDLSALAQSNQFQLIPVTIDQCKLGSPQMRLSQEQLVESCQRAVRLSQTGSVDPSTKRQCLISLSIYRAQITDWLTRDTALSDIKDPKVVADKLIASYIEEPGRAALTADRLLELEPNSYPAAKMSVMARMVDARKKNGRISEADYEKIKDRLTTAQRLDDKEEESLTEIAFALESSHFSDPAKLRQRASEVLQQRPGSGLGHYLLACTELKLGNSQAAKRYLLEAAKIDPQRYAQPLSVLQSMPPGFVAGICGTNLSLPTELLLPQG